MLKSHREAVPPQRWTGWGYESDPNVWSKAITQSDTQYWFGDALMIAGVYRPDASSARIYLPGRDTDPGFLNTSAPYEYLAAGRWHEISSVWHTSIPVIARIGSAIPVGKSVPTTCIAEENAEFPNIAKDDWRGVEIFPPPVICHPAISGNHIDEAPNEDDRWYTNEWIEDDGISPADKADIFKSTIIYAVSSEAVRLRVVFETEGGFKPLWLRNGLDIVLPVGDERIVSLGGNAQGQIERHRRDYKGRSVWRYTIANVQKDGS